jgi:hypothetical protein
MNVYDLVDKLGGEIVANKARAVVDGAVVIIGELKEKGLELTEEGVQLAEKHAAKAAPAKTTSAKTAPAKAAPKKRARNTDGTLKGDDPSTPDVNEAWTDGDD